MWQIFEAISLLLTMVLFLKVYILKRLTKYIPTETADFVIKKRGIACRNIPVASTILHGGYGFIPFLGIKPAMILERSSFWLPVFSFAGIKTDILLLFVDKDNRIFDTRIYDGRLLSKFMVAFSQPDLIIEIDMKALGLINPTLIGDTVDIRYNTSK